MSEPVELSFRRRLAAAFADSLGGRVYDLVSPPEATLPLVVYRRTGQGARAAAGALPEARLTVTFRGTEYAALKRLQAEVEGYFRGLRRTWLGPGDDGCPVWVHGVDVYTGPDGFMGATRDRTATSEFVIRYAEE